jgi:hypothetical protein
MTAAIIGLGLAAFVLGLLGGWYVRVLAESGRAGNWGTSQALRSEPFRPRSREELDAIAARQAAARAVFDAPPPQCHHRRGVLLCDRPAGHDGTHSGVDAAGVRSWWPREEGDR